MSKEKAILSSDKFFFFLSFLFFFFFYIYVGHRSCPVGRSSFLSMGDGPDIDSRPFDEGLGRACFLNSSPTRRTSILPRYPWIDVRPISKKHPRSSRFSFLLSFFLSFSPPLFRQHDSFDVKMHVTMHLLAVIVARTFFSPARYMHILLQSFRSKRKVRSIPPTCCDNNNDTYSRFFPFRSAGE